MVKLVKKELKELKILFDDKKIVILTSMIYFFAFNYKR